MCNQWLRVVISAAIVVFPAQAATYYVCDCRQGADVNCVNGNDNATGRSASTPWQTFDKAMQNFGTFAAGGGCYGIAVDAGYGTPEVFRNVTIRRNLVVNVGHIGIGVSSCRNCLIENNIIIQNQRGGGTGIAAPDRSLTAEDTASDSITVRNNTVYFGANVSSATGIQISDQGSHHACANNIVFMAGAGTTGSYLSLNLPSSSYSLVDYNLGFGGATSVRWEQLEWRSVFIDKR
jgi:parallel beta-helix repeat protein